MISKVLPSVIIYLCRGFWFLLSNKHPTPPPTPLSLSFSNLCLWLRTVFLGKLKRSRDQFSPSPRMSQVNSGYCDHPCWGFCYQTNKSRSQYSFTPCSSCWLGEDDVNWDWAPVNHVEDWLCASFYFFLMTARAKQDPPLLNFSQVDIASQWKHVNQKNKLGTLPAMSPSCQF